ncbi:hypothetical protein GCM10027269_47140 [Kribbella endophytica]
MEVEDLLAGRGTVGLEEADSLGWEASEQEPGRLLQGGTDGSHSLNSALGSQIDDVKPWHNERVPPAQWADVQERDRRIILVQHPRRQASRDDGAEGAGIVCRLVIHRSPVLEARKPLVNFDEGLLTGGATSCGRPRPNGRRPGRPVRRSARRSGGP